MTVSQRPPSPVGRAVSSPGAGSAHGSAQQVQGTGHRSARLGFSEQCGLLPLPSGCSLTLDIWDVGLCWLCVSRHGGDCIHDVGHTQTQRLPALPQ